MRLYFTDPNGQRLAIETERREYCTSESSPGTITDNHKFIKVSAEDFINLCEEIDFNAWNYSAAWLQPAADPGDLEYIKANLPPSEGDYITGNGEGVFILVDELTKEAHDADATGAGYTGILDNDSIYYKGLKHGEAVPLEMRGNMRPVVPFEWLLENYGPADV